MMVIGFVFLGIAVFLCGIFCGKELKDKQERK